MDDSQVVMIQARKQYSRGSEGVKIEISEL